MVSDKWCKATEYKGGANALTIVFAIFGAVVVLQIILVYILVYAVMISTGVSRMAMTTRVSINRTCVAMIHEMNATTHGLPRVRLRFARCQPRESVLGIQFGINVFGPSSQFDPAKFNKYCSDGNVEAVKALLQDKSFDPTTNDNHAYRMVVKSGNSEMFKLLISDQRIAEIALKPENIERAIETSLREILR